MNNAELIKALRETDFGYVCEHCEHEDMCRNNDCVIIQAADALEAAEAYEEAWSKKCERLEKKIAGMEAQLPKQGEWIVEEIDDDSGFKWCKWRCSVCREVVKKGWQHTKDGEKPKWKYCPNCGAKMKGENDGET